MDTEDGRLPAVPLKGIAMGLSDSVPGVSGGTMALVLGIYPRLVRAIAGIHPRLVRDLVGSGRREAWKDADLTFLVLLAMGLVTGLFLGARIISYVLGQEPVPLMAVLLGVLLASLRAPAAVPKWNAADIFVAVGMALIGLFVTLSPSLAAPTALWFLPLAGAIAACAMILPGISGAYILLLMGLYEPVIRDVGDLRIRTIVLVGSGAVLGLLFFTRGLRALLDRWNGTTHAAMVGLLVGSLARLWPWRDTPGFAEGAPVAPDHWMPFLWLAVGLATGVFLEWLGRRPPTQQE